MKDLIKQTLKTKVYEVAKETPLHYAEKLSEGQNVSVYLKREDLQVTHSFKLRGAYNKICNLSGSDKSKGIVTASAGNHAQGVAFSANKLGIESTIVMPATTPTIKVDAVKKLGGRVILTGDSYTDAYDHAIKIAAKSTAKFIHPFDDAQVIVGQGTIARELLEQIPDVTHIFVPVGGGGLIAGIAQFIKTIDTRIKIIGVEPDDSNAMQRSLKEKKRVFLKHVGIFADGVAVKQVGKLTFNIARKYVDKIITVNTDQICAAIKILFEDTRSIVEPAGALAVAGIQSYSFSNSKNAKAVAICSGANMMFERLQQIAERTLIGSGKEALFSVRMPEKPGALEKYCEKVLNGRSITEFSYRLNKRSEAQILVGISVVNDEDKRLFINKMKSNGYSHNDLSNDDITKEHIRHMIGGLAPAAKNEYFYQVEFPERAGALIDFLSALGNKLNISAFHYRSAASDTGNVLLAIETENRKQLHRQLDKAGYNWQSINENTALNVFIR